MIAPATPWTEGLHQAPLLILNKKFHLSLSISLAHKTNLSENAPESGGDVKLRVKSGMCVYADETKRFLPHRTFEPLTLETASNSSHHDILARPPFCKKCNASATMSAQAIIDECRCYRLQPESLHQYAHRYFFQQEEK